MCEPIQICSDIEKDLWYMDKNLYYKLKYIVIFDI